MINHQTDLFQVPFSVDSTDTTCLVYESRLRTAAPSSSYRPPNTKYLSNHITNTADYNSTTKAMMKGLGVQTSTTSPLESILSSSTMHELADIALPYIMQIHKLYLCSILEHIVETG